MTNNNENKLNKEGNDSLLSYTPSGSVAPSAASTEVESHNQSSTQFESRRARRMSETGLMPQVAKEAMKPAPTPVITNRPVQTPVDTSSPEQNRSGGGIMIPAPVLSSLTAAVKKPTKSFSKDYWGGTALLTSLAVFLVAQVIFAIILVVHILFNYDLLSSVQSDNIQVEQVLYDTPWLLLVSMIVMYIAWLGCMWWVSKYRSGVQKGKKYWGAFKDNFRLNNFKKRDIAYGVGIAAAMLGLQYLVLNVLPELAPSLKPELEASDNTGPFKNMDGFWFYLIGFGVGGLIGPICEELFFRGFLLRGFENHYSYKNSGRNMDTLEDELGAQSSTIKSMIVSYRNFTHNNRYILATLFSTVLFGLAHFQVGGSWITVALTGLLGLVFAVVTLKTNRLYPAIFAHIVHNSAVFLVLALSK
jgi:membrane protease YdiL (CAAX protease family)